MDHSIFSITDLDPSEVYIIQKNYAVKCIQYIISNVSQYILIFILLLIFSFYNSNYFKIDTSIAWKFFEFYTRALYTSIVPDDGC